jgi:hypothetical protein
MRHQTQSQRVGRGMEDAKHGMSRGCLLAEKNE